MHSFKYPPVSTLHWYELFQGDHEKGKKGGHTNEKDKLGFSRSLESNSSTELLGDGPIGPCYVIVYLEINSSSQYLLLH